MSTFDDQFEVNQDALDRYNNLQAIDQEIAEDKQAADAEAAQLKADEDKAASMKNPDGSLKDSHEIKDPKEFGAKENLQEVGNALAGGAVDAWNSVVSIPKFFDPKFYQPDTPEKPYLYDNPLVVKDKPITRTVWGNAIRTVTEFGIGMVGVGKVGMAIKGVKGLQMAAKGSALGRVGLSAAQGAVYDTVSNTSQQGNVAAALIEMKPEWSNVLKPIATTDDMSPAQRALMNTAEGLGIGTVIDLGMEGVGASVRALKPAAKGNVPNPTQEALERSSRIEYGQKTEKVQKYAQKDFEAAVYRQQKAANLKLAQLQADATGEAAVVEFPTQAEWKANNQLQGIDHWKALSDDDKLAYMAKAAEKHDLDWGATRDFSRRAAKQGKANQAVAEDQYIEDLANGTPRQNPAYYDEGDVTDNQALTNTSRPTKGVRDMISIRNDWEQAQGSPRGPLSEAHIRRLEYGAPGLSKREIDQIADQLVADPAFQAIYGGKKTPTNIKEDFIEAATELRKFLDDGGNQRAITDLSEDDLREFIDSFARTKNGGEINKTIIEGREVLNHSQLIATDLVISQLTHGMRDLARGAVNVADEVAVGSPGSLMDGIIARWNGLTRIRKETSTLSSWNLRRFSPSLEDYGKMMEESDAAVSQAGQTLKQLIRDNANDELLQVFNHFVATNGANKTMLTDFNAFMSRNLRGYAEGDRVVKNKIVDELATMGINSMLSGPKTPVRAAVGTGLNTIMRPVATIIGSLGQHDKEGVIRGAHASMGAMFESLGEAWRVAVADFHAYTQMEDGWRGFTPSSKDFEWEALKESTKLYGSDGDKAFMGVADAMRTINKLPIFNYGPRILQSSDAFFRTLIGRAQIRQDAVMEVWDQAKQLGKAWDDAEIPKMIKAAEERLESKVFTADGLLSDGMAKYAYQEAAFTKDLQGFGKKLDEAFKAQPYLRPFMLFMKTGVNALELTGKYTPVLNSFIEENVDILTRNFDDPKLLRYGIKTAQDLEVARATVRGRQAIGYGFTAMVAMAAANGQITGNGPPDRELREAWKQFGWRPRSLKIGDQYVSYEALEPFNAFLSMAADIADGQKVMGEQWTADSYGKLAYVVTQNITNKSFLAGIFQITEAFNGGMKLPQIAANLVNNQVPLSGMRNEIGKVLSPGMRELEKGFLQSIYNRNLYVDLIPGNTPNYRYDILNGQPLQDYDLPTRLWNGVSPFMVNPTVNPTRDLLYRSGVDLKLTFNTGPNKESLEGRPDLKSKFQYYISQQNIEEKLNKLFQDPKVVESIIKMENDRDNGRRYEAADTFHNALIERVLKEAKQNAWKHMSQDTPDIQQLNTLARQEGLAATQRKQGNQRRADQLQTIIEMSK
jgi:hypothetical protein